METKMWRFVVLLHVAFVSISPVTGNSACCSFPCQNAGVCLTEGESGYICDCEATSFYGKNCEIPTFSMRIRLALRPDLETQHYILTNYKWIWDIINSIYWLRGTLMRMIYLGKSSVVLYMWADNNVPTVRAEMVDSPPLYESYHSYTNWDAIQNATVYQRALPPVPENCPTPLGTAGKKTLPDVEVMVDRLFTRHKFIPEESGSNMLFTFFAQHFSHMFFKTTLGVGDGGLTWGGHGVDMSTVYGPNKATELALREMKGGRMKTTVINGEEWPPFLKDAKEAKMIYPPHVPMEKRHAIGHEFFGLLPGLLVYANIWLREHNRVCALLEKEHPSWDDERLFQTSKLILLGETIKIVIEDYVQHLSKYNYELLFDPELLFGYPFQYQNKIAVEFNHLYHWHPLMPESFNVSGKMYSAQQYIFNSELATNSGMKAMVESLAAQRAGKVTLNNHSPITAKVAKETILHGRALRFQSFNNYRRRYRLKPYSSFLELTGDKASAAILEEFYGEVDAVEFYVGVIAEKHRPKAMFGSTVIEMGGPFSVKGLMSNPLCSPRMWRPSTFGGQKFFDIVKSASLKKLFCSNLEGECPEISFTSTEYKETEVETSRTCKGSNYCKSIQDFVEL